MTWAEVRQLHPHCWVVIEAIGAYNEGIHRHIPEISIFKVCGDDWQETWQHYKRLHDLDRSRELYYFHTDRVELTIELMDKRGRKIDAQGRYRDSVHEEPIDDEIRVERIEKVETE